MDSLKRLLLRESSRRDPDATTRGSGPDSLYEQAHVHMDICMHIDTYIQKCMHVHKRTRTGTE